MSSMFGALKKIVYDTTTEIIDNDIPTKVADVLKTLVTSTFDVVDDALTKIQDLTKEEPAETEES